MWSHLGSVGTGVNSNYSCWYWGIRGEVRSSKKACYNHRNKSGGARLLFSNVLCQNVTTLVIGSMYQLNFTVYNNRFNMYTSEVRVLINNKAAFNHTTLGALGFSNASYIMTAPSTNTQICFNYSLIPGWLILQLAHA